MKTKADGCESVCHKLHFTFTLNLSNYINADISSAKLLPVLSFLVHNGFSLYSSL